MKKLRKLMCMILAMAMVLSMGVPASAVTNGQKGWELIQEKCLAGPISVKVVLQTKQSQEGTSINDVFDVNLDKPVNAKDGFTVKDALLNISNEEMKGVSFLDAKGNKMTADTDYVEAVQQDGTTYAPAVPDSEYPLDGLVVRVNDQFQILSTSSTYGPTGASIAETPIHNGDVIFMYWDYPYNKTVSELYSTDYVSANVTYANGTIDIQALSSNDYFGNDYYWHISDFTPYEAASGATAMVYDSNGKSIGSAKFDKTGKASISGTTLTAGGTYYVTADTTTYQDAVGYDVEMEEYLTWKIMKSTMIYEKFTIPSK